MSHHCFLKVLLSGDDGERGAVLVEYVIVLSGMVLPLVIGAEVLFSPSGDFAGTFGLLGEMYRQAYNTLLDGLSLPIPLMI